MKKWISSMLAVGFLATTAFITTAADNVTITLGTNTSASTFMVLDNESNVLLGVAAGNDEEMSGTMVQDLAVEDNLSVMGSIHVDGFISVNGAIMGAGRATYHTGTGVSLELSPGDNSTVVVNNVNSNTVTLPTPTGSGIIYTIYNADDDNISVKQPSSLNSGNITPINPAQGTQSHQVAPGTKTDCVDVGAGMWKCFSY
jgi:hypothetical protein